MSKKKIFLIVGGGALLLIMIAVGVSKSRGNRKIVETEKLEKRTLSQKVTASGKLQAKRKADLSATVMGQIINIAVKEGDKVRKGDILLQIDRTRANAEAGQSRSGIAMAVAEAGAAEANLDQARKDAQRAEQNFQKHIISEAEYQRTKNVLRAQQGGLDAARSRVQQSRAQLDAASDSLNKTTLRAPMDGVVTRKAVEEGEMAVIGTMNNPGTVLLTVSDMSVLEAELEASETDVPQVKPGQTALISIDAFSGQKFEGVVTEVGASPWIKTDPGSVNTGIIFKIKVEVKNPPADVRPGFTVTADIETARREGVVAVPLQAIVEKPPEPKSASAAEPQGGGTGSGAREDKVVRAADKVVEQLGVFTLKNGKVQFVPVTTGVHGDLYIEATDGPKEGELVITGPFRILRELKIGDAVQPRKPGPAGKK